MPSSLPARVPLWWSRLYPETEKAHVCDVCRVRMKTGRGKAWRCKLCDFDLCQSCYEKKVPSPVPCSRDMPPSRPPALIRSAASVPIVAKVVWVLLEGGAGDSRCGDRV